jgi:hypothetical protein
MKFKTLIASMITASALSLSQSDATTVYGVTEAQHFVVFDSASPMTFSTDVAITGIASGYEIVGMDMRTTVQTSGAANPGVGTLWAIATNMTNYQLYVISTSGVASPVGGLLTGISSVAPIIGNNNWAFAFDPARDRFQLVGERHNFEINPNTATAVHRPNVFTETSMFPAFSGGAFSSASFGGTTTFYIADTGAHRLAQSADVNAGGLLAFNGSAVDFGAGLSSGPPNALDIANGLVLFAANTGGTGAKLYNLNLSSGVATLINSFPMGVQIRGIAIQPTSFPPKPSVIVKISGAKTITTSASSRLVRGTVKSNIGVDRVEYRVGTKGQFKKAIGTTKWRFTARLKPGKNIVFVRAKKESITSKIAKVTIVRE